MDRSSFWFPAKHYGWGWGLPIHWMGWIALGLYVAGLVAAAYVFRPGVNLYAYLGCAVALSAAFIALCLLKGEPPAWRWGERS